MRGITEATDGGKRRTRLGNGIAATLAAIVLAMGLSVSGGAPAFANSTSYYLDCSSATNGTGTSSSPWNTLSSANGHTFSPGDQLLLRAGTSCSGYFQASGSGASGSQIVIQPYGSGAAPTINAGGAAEGAVILRDVSYWTVQNIAVTNNAPTSGKYSGVLVDATDNGTYSGITIAGIDVSNVNGVQDRNATNRYSTGGITVRTPALATGLSGHFAGVNIQNNVVHDVHCMGIDIVGGDGVDSVTHSTNVWVHGNTVIRSGADAILVGVSQSPLVEHNVSEEDGWNNTNTGAIAAMWTYTSSDPTFQYNEADTTENSADSEAWDCDWGTSGACTYQYNYSNSNYGGFFLDCTTCDGNSHGASIVLRYNLSQNEGRMVDDSNGSMQMYNNTFDAPGQTFSLGVTSSAIVKNNIFVGKGLNTLPAGATFNNNLWWGFTAPSSDSAAIAKDPLLVEDSAGGYGTGTTSGTTMGATGGFELSAGSPALSSGVLISGNGGSDFWGNAVSASTAPNVGAYNGAAQTQAWTEFNDTSSQFTYTSYLNNNSWGYLSSRGLGEYQDDVHYTGSNNDSATFTFHGTGVKILTDTASDQGVVNYNLDNGATTGSFDTSASSPARRVQVPVLALTGLSAGQHTLTLTKVSGSYMLVDRADVLPITYNDTATQVAYTSYLNNNSWGYGSSRGLGEYQDDVHYTAYNNDYATFTFTGTGVKVFTDTASDEGNVSYSLDAGAATGSFNAASTSRHVQVPMLVLSGLSNATHTITLTKASGTYMLIDRFDVTG